MMQTIVRSATVLFGLLCISGVVLIFLVGDTYPSDDLDSLADRFYAKPTEQRLRDLLNYPADGEYSYYQAAITGVAFTRHPEIFKQVSETLETEGERYRIEQLRTLGDGIFEYHPELKPKDFDALFRSFTLMTQQQAEQSGGGNSATLRASP